VYVGTFDGKCLVAAFRESLVLVPTEVDEALLTGDAQGVRWVYAFTSGVELARFGRARGQGGVEWSYLTVRGSRLLDGVLPAMGRPAGVAVDVAGARPMMFPAATEAAAAAEAGA
jgi:hypothetical protein